MFGKTTPEIQPVPDKLDTHVINTVLINRLQPEHRDSTETTQSEADRIVSGLLPYFYMVNTLYRKHSPFGVNTVVDNEAGIYGLQGSFRLWWYVIETETTTPVRMSVLGHGPDPRNRGLVWIPNHDAILDAVLEALDVLELASTGQTHHHLVFEIDQHAHRSMVVTIQWSSDTQTCVLLEKRVFYANLPYFVHNPISETICES